jgi:Putative peptidoglycan binding domain
VQGTDSSRSRDPDDWFAESDWATGPAPERSALADDTDAGGRPRRALSDLTFTLRTLLLAAFGVVAIVVVIGLVIGGVFSGSSHHRTTSPPASTPTTTKHTTPPTTTVRRPQHRAPTAPLKPGDTGTQVKLLQRALAQLGYKPGSVDGDYGSSTVAAVTRFQRASKLTADGVVGPATLSALKRALATTS